MKHVKLLHTFKAILAAVATVSASAFAAPIFSEADSFSVASPRAVAVSAGAAESPLFSNMRLNGGQNLSVAFLGDDNSILIGYYSRGPWSKSEFLRSGHNGDGGATHFVPSVETVQGLPEPSTLALLGLGLLALGALQHRQAKR